MRAWRNGNAMMRAALINEPSVYATTLAHAGEDDLEVQVAGGSKTHEVVEPQALEGLNYDHSFHMKKILEVRPSDVNFMVFDMMPPNLQRAITTVDSFWTDGWASYSAKTSAEVKLNAWPLLPSPWF
ncbi:hypothetical protein Fot_06871 [Forsythia ovata]|uniref:Uncharacterized protein n=1 Tax=Forsythia ovata TaxID=205694 RepID=A0ABD1WU80_9LAMI